MGLAVETPDVHIRNLDKSGAVHGCGEVLKEKFYLPNFPVPTAKENAVKNRYKMQCGERKTDVSGQFELKSEKDQARKQINDCG